MSNPSRSSCFMFRYISFTIRFARFRSTAFLKPRAAETANRFRSRSFFTNFILTPGQLTCLREANARRISCRPRRRSSLVRLLLIGNAQFGAPLPAPPGEYEPAAFGLHTCSETELSIPLDSTGLIGPLHRDRSSSKLCYEAGIAPETGAGAAQSKRAPRHFRTSELLKRPAPP